MKKENVRKSELTREKQRLLWEVAQVEGMYEELNNDELLDIDGGVAPIVIALVKIGGTAFIAGAGWRLGEEIYDGVKGLFD